jgi:hypothetical protein
MRRVRPIRVRRGSDDRVRLCLVAATQLLVFGFGSGAAFEGQLVGALERIESGGALRILDALFIQRDADTGELAVVDLRSNRASGIVAPLIGFRLDPGERRRLTKRALTGRAGGVPGDTLRDLGGALKPGAALAAVLIEHRWAEALDDAVARTGGTALVSELVHATTLGELADELLAAAARCGEADPIR